MRFIENDLGYLDSVTGLIWAKEDSEQMTWEQAMAVEKDGWRVPTIEELLSIVDYSKHSPAADLPGIQSAYYWSASPVAFDIYYAWVVYFYYGYDNYYYMNHNFYVRLVRSGQ